MTNDMVIIGIDPNTEFIAYCIMSNEKKILDKGICNLSDGMTQFLNNKVKEYNVNGISVEDYEFYGKILNHYHMDTIKLIGRIQQYCEMKELKYWAFTKPDINKSISRNSRSKKASMQGFVKWHLGLKEVIRPQHVNDAVCVAIHCINYLKAGWIK